MTTFDWNKLISNTGLRHPGDMGWNPITLIAEDYWLVSDSVVAQSFMNTTKSDPQINFYIWLPNIKLLEWATSGESIDDDSIFFCDKSIPDCWPYPIAKLSTYHEIKSYLESHNIFHQTLPHIRYSDNTVLGLTLAFDRTLLYFNPMAEPDPSLLMFKVMVGNARVGSTFLFQ